MTQVSRGIFTLEEIQSILTSFMLAEHNHKVKRTTLGISRNEQSGEHDLYAEMEVENESKFHPNSILINEEEIYKALYTYLINELKSNQVMASFDPQHDKNYVVEGVYYTIQWNK